MLCHKARMRRFGTPPRADISYHIRPGAYAIITRGQHILLTHQDIGYEEIQLPGGGIDAGEGPLTALHREAYEETGWKIAPIRKLGAYRNFVYMPEYNRQAEKVCHIYHCHAVRKISEPIEPDHQAIWADATTALDILEVEGDRYFLELFLRNR